jgi:segregation and condensation protein B
MLYGTMATLHKALEAILFVSEQPLSISELQDALVQTGVDLGAKPEATVEAAMAELKERYAAADTALGVFAIGEGYQILTQGDYHPYIREAIRGREQKKLSKTVMETLAIIAYQQPAAKSQIDYIRGVDSGYALQKLLDRELIQPDGRADTPGRPLLYSTTPQFMRYFGLQSLQDLPKPKEIKRDEEAVEEAYRTQKGTAEGEASGPQADPGEAAPTNGQANGGGPTGGPGQEQA